MKIYFLFAITMLSSFSFAQSTIAIPAIEDVRLMKAHPNNNNGAEPAVWLKSGNGRDRILVKFDLTALNGISPASISDVKIELVKDYTRLANSTLVGFEVDAYPMHNNWVQGNGIWDRYVVKLPGESFPVKRSHSTGQAATWNCPIDFFADDGVQNCTNPWFGSNYTDVLLDRIRIFKNDPAGVDGLTKYQWNVTPAIIAALNQNQSEVSILIKKRYEASEEASDNNSKLSTGKVYFFSTEGAVHYRDPIKSPKLIITVNP